MYLFSNRHIIKLMIHKFLFAIIYYITFLDQYNGRSPFPDLSWSENDTLYLFTDSCGSYDGGAIFQNHWAVTSWPKSWGPDISRNITILELVPILVAFWVWSDQFTAKKLPINTDNTALVDLLNAKFISISVSCLL